MVKHFNQQLRREEILQQDKINAKIEQLRLTRRRELVRDTKRNCIKRGVAYQPPKMNVNEFMVANREEVLAKGYDEKDKEVHCYKVALASAKEVLEKLDKLGVKNDRPADYLVEMYKSDRQMFKVRRHLTEREEQVKQKMQGKDWESKNKRREKAKKKAEVKRERKKVKLAAKRQRSGKGSTSKPSKAVKTSRSKSGKVTGKHKTKKVHKRK